MHRKDMSQVLYFKVLEIIQSLKNARLLASLKEDLLGNMFLYFSASLISS